ncbi:inorganic phosphate transporter [Candidatus Micrarchaeota archaeon]|nr:inorganic phosphate transporter [Candidatus Micrarchaeota archaeon]MBU2476641.1 inorganic phosphate transporter [Candidatus Micrarchaeota archaeon]
MLDSFVLVVIGIIVALIFDFGNGLNDAANAISTVVATRVLSLRSAVLLSAFFNFVAAFVFSVAVAKTIGKGLVDPSIVTPTIVISGLIGSILWVYASSFMGLPVSASHALVGGFIGSALIAAGSEVLILPGILMVFAFIFIAPILGMIGSFLFSFLVYHLIKKTPPGKVNNWFKRLQLISVSVYSLGHGTNDAQKTMGIISLLLFSGGFLGTQFDIPWWVIILSHTTIALGTIAGGWRVVKTMGTKITKLKPVNGFCAETSGAGVIIASSMFGIPVSTTHVISGSIIGVGLTKRVSAVRWGIARNIVWAWILTIPVTALVGALSYLILNPIVNAL